MCFKRKSFIITPKLVLDELPAESTTIESDNIVQRYSKRPRQLQRFCLADVDVIYPKGNKLTETIEDRNDCSISNDISSNENSGEEGMVANGNTAPDLIHIAKNGTKHKHQ